MTRYERIIDDAEKMTKGMPFSEKQSFKCVFYKTEIRHLLKEIETLEAKLESQNTCKPGPVCNRGLLTR